jgi:hypothetical protein
LSGANPEAAFDGMIVLGFYFVQPKLQIADQPKACRRLFEALDK